MLSAREVVARVSQAIPSVTFAGVAYGSSGAVAHSESHDYAESLAKWGGAFRIIAQFVETALRIVIDFQGIRGH